MELGLQYQPWIYYVDVCYQYYDLMCNLQFQGTWLSIDILNISLITNVSLIENDMYVFSIASYNIYECNINPHNIAEHDVKNYGAHVTPHHIWEQWYFYTYVMTYSLINIMLPSMINSSNRRAHLSLKVFALHNLFYFSLIWWSWFWS